MSRDPGPREGAGSGAPRDRTARQRRPGAFPRPLVRFVELFNRRAFWESHEVLEGPWRTEGSAFYQGLILYASAFVHVQRDNAHGIAAQLRKAERALAPFAPHYLGVDVDAVLRGAKAVRERVEGTAARPGEEDSAENGNVRWDARITFPRLKLDPARVRGHEPELAGEDRGD